MTLFFLSSQILFNIGKISTTLRYKYVSEFDIWSHSVLLALLFTATARVLCSPAHSMEALFRHWAELPIHIVDIMVIKIDRFSDFVRFAAVCQLWRDAALEANVDHKLNLSILKASRKKLPMLMFKTEENIDEGRSLYSVSNRRTYEVKLPLPYKYRFVGSSRGWLFCLDEVMVVTLVNPYNNTCISLPVFRDPIELFQGEWMKRYFDFYIRKGIILADPHACPDSFGVVVVYGGMCKLAFYKSGEPSWHFINSEDDDYVDDIICYKDKVYSVDPFGKFVHIDIVRMTVETIVPATDDHVNRVYLVNSQEGELLMVKRVWLEWLENDNQGEDTDNEYSDNEAESLDSPNACDYDDDEFPRSFRFKVFKLTHPIEERLASWVEIDNIGQQALFIGENSVSVSTSEFPGCLPNSIYYTSQHYHECFPYSYRGSIEDSGIFNLGNKEFYLHHVLDSSRKYVQPPIWFVPNPRELDLD